MRSRSPANRARLVAAGAGADFEHRGALVGGVARQQLQRQVALGLGELRLIVGQLLGGHLAELLARPRAGISSSDARPRRAAAAPPAPPRRPARSRHNPWRAARTASGARSRRRHRLLQFLLAAPRWRRSVRRRCGSLPRVRLRRTSRSASNASSIAGAAERGSSGLDPRGDLAVRDPPRTDRARRRLDGLVVALLGDRLARTMSLTNPCRDATAATARSARLQRASSSTHHGDVDALRAPARRSACRAARSPPPSRPPACAGRRGFRSGRHSGRRRSPRLARRAGR